MIEALTALAGGFVLSQLAQRWSGLRREPRSFCDLLPWISVAAPGLLLTKTGGLLATFELAPCDPVTTPAEALATQVASLTRNFTRLASGSGHYTFWLTLERRPLAPLPSSPYWSHPLGHEVERQRAEHRLRHPQFTNRVFLSLLLHRGKDVWDRLHTSNAQDSAAFDALVEAFETDLETLVDGVAAVLPLRRLVSQEQVGLLAQLLGLDRLAVPADPQGRVLCYLDQYLGALPVVTHPLTVGERSLAVATVLGFPEATDVAFLHDLTELPAALTLSARLHVLDSARSLKYLSHLETRLARVGFDFRQVLAAPKAESEAADRRLQKAKQRWVADRLEEVREVGAQVHAKTPLVVFTLTATAAGADPQAARDALRPVIQALEKHGFTAHLETDNAFPAFLGSLPGSFANVRRTVIPLPNALHLAALTSSWAGAAVNQTPDAEPPIPLFQATTSGSTGFHFNLFSPETQVAHTLILGATGSGKSVLLQALAFHAGKYRQARVLYCDNGRSARVLAAATGAPFLPLFDREDENPYGLQPLARLNSVEDRAGALEWLAALPSLHGLDPLPEHLPVWRDLLEQLRALPPERRTLAEAAVQCQHRDLKRVLEAYGPQTPWGRLFERPEPPALHSHPLPLTVFELRALLGAPRAVSAPALSYLFTSFERLLHEAPAKGPTLILVDEAWTALAGGPFADFVENALRTFRKLNAGVVLATQSPADLRGSRLWNILVESCPTRIILPGSHAVTTSADLLADLGLTETERQLVAQATPRLEYFVSSPSGSRLFRLGLSELEKAVFTTPPGVSLHQTIELALSCQRQDPEGWLSTYLSRRKELHGN